MIDDFIATLRTALGDEWRVYKTIVGYEHEAINIRRAGDINNVHRVFVKNLKHVMDSKTGLMKWV